MYKYSCRECPIRDRCIDESDTGSGAKEMIRNAFIARTDTLSTWGVLQKNCLLVKEDEERERRAKEGSLLGRRLREAREAKDKLDEDPVEETIQPTDQAQQILPVTPPSPEPTAATPPEPDYASPISSTTPFQDEVETSKLRPSPGGDFGTHLLEPSRLDQELAPKYAAPCWLIIRDSQRRISLPITGEVVLGRFDPYMKVPLDVDLTYEDRKTMSVSRRHAQIIGVDGRHTIEDLQSSNGLFINGVRAIPSRAHQLQPGDRISLGGLEMRYDRVPADFLDTLSIEAAQVRHFLLLTQTGHKIAIAPSNNIIIGRPDPAAGFMPGIDLSQAGEAAVYVSRRHASITWRNDTPYLEDLQSTSGTRLNGDVLPPNRAAPLKPGDHMSLGGCVLAYDVEV